MSAWLLLRDGVATTRVEWDGNSETWQPPKGFVAVPDDGRSIATQTPVDPTPAFVTNRQLKLALLAAGKLDSVEAYAKQSSREAQISWEYAAEFHRQHPMLVEMAAAFGMSDADLDALFTAAAQII